MLSSSVLRPSACTLAASAARVGTRTLATTPGGINTSTYPIHDLNSPERKALVEQSRKTLMEKGVVTFPNFLTPEAVSTCADEARTKAPDAYSTDDTHNAYLLPEDKSLPPDHTRNLRMRTRVASTAYDELDTTGTLRQLYDGPDLVRFVGDILGKKEFYRLADPLGACSVNVFRPGCYHSYHFDETEFTTTLMLQKAEDGGDFEFIPHLRASNTELVLDKVQSALQGDIQPTKLDFNPGTLSIFAGRYALHRVTEVKGSRDRLVAVLCFAQEEGKMNSSEVQKLFWGRSIQPEQAASA